MAISKPITRVEQYLAHISGMRVNVPEVPLTREEMYLASWARKSGIEDTEMQGEPPLTLKDCIGEPFNGLVLYGKSTQVTTTGAQLLDLSDLIGKTETKNGATYKINEDQSISVSGTPTEYTSFYLKAMSLKAGSYYFSSNSDNYKVFVQLIGVKLNMNNGFTLDEDTDNIGVYVVFNVVSNNTESFNMTFTSMLNAGDTALPWEPYTGGKPSPSPDYPQEIQSAGDDGNVAISVTGKNLLDISKANVLSLETSLGCNIMPKSGCIKIFGNTTRESYISFSPDTIPIGKKVFLLLKTEGSSHLRLRIAYQKESEKKVSYIYSGDEFLRENTSYKVLTIQLIAMSGEFNDEVYPMITTEKDTTFEPYKGERLLTFSTPNGLPGILVTSGGNYTDENGQQWICDEVNLERGVYVQRVKKSVIGDVTWRMTNANAHEFATEALINTGKSYFYANGLCDMYNVVVSNQKRYTDKSVILGIDGYQLFVCDSKFSTLDEIKEYFAEHPLTIMYVLATPIETPLSEADIAAYRALTTYKGTTILGSECYLKVKYSKLRK